MILLIASGAAGAQRLLEFRDDLVFSPAEINAVAARDFDSHLGSLDRAGRLDADPTLWRRLERIFPGLLRAAAYERPGAVRITWELHVCSACPEYAMATPGGTILVSADFVARHALTDDELAYLVAHEMAHVLAEHTREFATAARFFVSRGMVRHYADIEQELGNNLAVLLRMSPVSVEQELAADYIGFILGARAGFAPEAMLGLLDKLAIGGGAPLLGSHPVDSQRMKQARAMLESARRLATAAPGAP